MTIIIYEKPVIRKFVNINGKDIELDALYSCLYEIKDTKENDKYGDNSLRDYELSYPNEMNILVELDLVSNYRGSRMANLFCMKNEKGIDELLELLNTLDK